MVCLQEVGSSHSTLLHYLGLGMLFSLSQVRTRHGVTLVIPSSQGTQYPLWFPYTPDKFEIVLQIHICFLLGQVWDTTLKHTNLSVHQVRAQSDGYHLWSFQTGRSDLGLENFQSVATGSHIKNNCMTLSQCLLVKWLCHRSFGRTAS